ncbi:hypothetical protein J6590_036183 [Homalodisca vitripennis]|nr:hypothetical protein J6590_036183 [Homalodisca vitripennis]
MRSVAAGARFADSAVFIACWSTTQITAISADNAPYRNKPDDPVLTSNIKAEMCGITKTNNDATPYQQATDFDSSLRDSAAATSPPLGQIVSPAHTYFTPFARFSGNKGTFDPNFDHTLRKKGNNELDLAYIT